ncbi:MAG: L,D-transpeptidase [Anaerolineales bacterium]
MQFQNSLLVLAMIFSLAPLPVSAAGASQDVSCPTSAYQVRTEDCLQTGPWISQRLQTEYGLLDPDEVFPSFTPESSLTQLPFYYARVTAEPAPIYASPADAAAGEPVLRTIESGLVYVTYQDVQEFGGKNYYMINFGEWMRRGDITPNQVYSQFMGLQFYATPSRPFGWVLEYIQARTAPGLNSPLADRFFDVHEIIQVYDFAEANGLRWFRVGPDLWLDSRHTKLVFPNTTPPDGVDGNRWIDINLQEQTIAVYDKNQLVFATLIATGLPGVWTRPGLFPIYEKHESTLMRGSFSADRSDFYFLEDVPWTMYFDEARALHGAFWRHRLGFEQSHGCVNLSVGDSHWLFNWGEIGDWVYVHDPSGRTPTDPALYGSGGA